MKINTRLLEQSMFEKVVREGDKINVYGYSNTHGEEVLIVSLKMEIPDYMIDVIDEDEVTWFIEDLILSKKIAREVEKERINLKYNKNI